MYGRKRMLEEEYSRDRNNLDDDEIDEEDDEEESDSDTVAQRPNFCEGMRSFAPSHMHISCHYDIPYHPHFLQPPVCSVPTFTYTGREVMPSQTTFFNGDSEQFCHSNKPDEVMRHVCKAERPFFFFGDHPNLPDSPLNIVGEVYCTVPGRTSLLSSTTKYRVTVGEIQRRISPPECLNASLLGGILRKAKAKDGGKTLRDSLKTLGLTLPAGRRKQAHVTAWTALVEEEAVHMAKDFSMSCEKEFHSREIGIYLTKNALNLDADVMKRRNMLEQSRKIISELGELLSCDKTPLTPVIPRNNIQIDPSIQHHLSHFTLMTHGFGSVAMCAVLECVKSTIDESIKFLDRTCPPAQPHVFYCNR